MDLATLSRDQIENPPKMFENQHHTAEMKFPMYIPNLMMWDHPLLAHIQKAAVMTLD